MTVYSVRTVASHDGCNADDHIWSEFGGALICTDLHVCWL